MKMKIKQQNENRYTINGMVLMANTYKDAIAEYVSIVGSGAKIQFAKK